MRFVIISVVTFAVGLLLGKVTIPMLRAWKAGQSIREIGPSWHASKSGTPTMGGIIFILATLVSVLFAIPEMLSGNLSLLFVFLFSLAFGLIGFFDDYIKVKKKRNLGLTSKQKFLLQLAVSLLFVLLLRQFGYLTNDLFIPFFGCSFTIPWWLYIIFAIFVIVGCVNAVNLTDGIDGLASGVTLPVMVFFAVVSLTSGIRSVAAFPLSLAAGLLAFLVYNYHPAKVFMGDTGSLFLGGAVCGLAFALDMPLVLIPIGIIYIIETLSVILQVGYFKLTHGKRIFKMTPIHHHFEMCGWSEYKIFWVAVSITVGMCVLTYFGVSSRIIG